jgi:hypothetical protein
MSDVGPMTTGALLDPDIDTDGQVEHDLTIVALYHDVTRYFDRMMHGGASYYLEEAGRTDLLADRYHGACSCEARSEDMADWKDARWWCREHRTSMRMPVQPWLPEDILLIE